ncbi:MAG: hypothetical protein ACE5R6_20960 [Candidatus Heimdallarchaeota archaeon]
MMKHRGCAIIAPTWTHSYENRSDFRRSSPGHRPVSSEQVAHTRCT